MGLSEPATDAGGGCVPGAAGIWQLRRTARERPGGPGARRGGAGGAGGCAWLDARGGLARAGAAAAHARAHAGHLASLPWCAFVSTTLSADNMYMRVSFCNTWMHGQNMCLAARDDMSPAVRHNRRDHPARWRGGGARAAVRDAAAACLQGRLRGRACALPAPGAADAVCAQPAAVRSSARFCARCA